ncbi:hypothetical protein VTJ49DRAFT_7134 [Mycothermus thermophilus]|uniref:Uncharacterized protein n=1 Tax=Humicola insolens TaxID=85995 RepID=A0ABR3VHT8_HUMIN
MATTTDSAAFLPFKMHVTSDNTGLWRIRQTEEAAKTVSELLQKDMEIPHHLLALYGTGAPPSALRAAYAHNDTYQRPALPPHRDLPVVPFLPWPRAAEPYFGREEYYPDFLRFFQEEGTGTGTQQQSQVEGKGEVAQEVKEGGKRREGDSPLLTRLFAGFLHPLIQLMYGIEWAQEAVVAEGLAQAAVHSGEIGEYLLAAEELARKQQQQQQQTQESERGESILSLLNSVRTNKKLAHAARNSDSSKIRDGVMARAKDEMLSVAARVHVRPEEVEEKTAEMFDAAVFVAAAAALERVGRPGNKKPAKIDFFLIPFFVTINAQPWIPPETKARLLEWKIRMDLLQYAARGAPELSVEKLKSYQPQKPDAGGSGALTEIITRLHTTPDDGHSIKLGRALGVCRAICQPYEEEQPPKPWLAIKGDEMWKKVCHLVVDSVEAPGPRWVRSTGFDEAWEEIPDVEA